MFAFRHPLLRRLTALALLLSLTAGVGGTARARPAEAYGAWLREQARNASRTLVDAALARVAAEAGRGDVTPGAFLDAYAAAQQALADPAQPAPSGAWFGLDGLSFREAIARLKGDLAGFDATHDAAGALTAAAPRALSPTARGAGFEAVLSAHAALAPRPAADAAPAPAETPARSAPDAHAAPARGP